MMTCRAQWAGQDVNAGSIKTFWQAISSRLAAVEDCLERTASSEKGQRLLLQAGLAETEKQLREQQHEGMSLLDKLKSLEHAGTVRISWLSELPSHSEQSNVL